MKPSSEKSVLDKMKALAAETQSHLRMTQDEKRRAVRSVPGVDYARAISPIGRCELIAKSGRDVRLVDVVSNRVFELKSHEVICAAFSRKGRQFVVGTRKGKVLLCNSEDATVERELGSFSDAVRSVAYSPDGEWLAVGCDWNVIRLIGPGNQRMELMVGSGRDKVFARRGVSVSSVRFNAKGTKLAVALDTTWRSDSVGLVEIWDVKSESREQTIVCPSAVGVAGFDEDGHVLTAEWSGAARVWSASSIRGKWFGSKSQQLGVAMVPKDGVSAAAFSQDAIRLEEMVAMHANWSNSRPGVLRRIVQ